MPVSCLKLYPVESTLIKFWKRYKIYLINPYEFVEHIQSSRRLVKKVFKCNLIITDVTFIFLGTFLIKYWNHRTTVEFAMIRTGIRLER